MKTLIYFLPIINPLSSGLNNLFHTFLAKTRHDYKVDIVLQSLSLMCFCTLWLDPNFNYPNKALYVWNYPIFYCNFLCTLENPMRLLSQTGNQFSYCTFFCGSSRYEKWANTCSYHIVLLPSICILHFVDKITSGNVLLTLKIT